MSHSTERHELQQELLTQSQADEAAQLLAVADQLLALAKPERSPASHHAGWQGVHQQIENYHQPRWRFHWQFALTPALLLVVLVSTISVAQSALPGQALYSVKIRSENAQLAVTLSPAKKANLCSRQMLRRANELATLAPTPVSDQTIRQLDAAILQEAIEFKSYANHSSEYGRLDAQRQRDASDVIETLTPALQTVHSPTQAKSIQSTIDTMRAITDHA
ncbi:MAG: DUF5667 domain-containing protein [Candidatus Saccharibacteria bacterium]